MNRKRVSIFIFAGACLSLLGCNTSQSTVAVFQPPSTKPNVVIIFADDLGFSDLGCYGGEIKTPNLDYLAGNGLLWTQFYNTARCWPSRAALMSGYYAQQVNRDRLPASKGRNGDRPSWAPLLPQYLAKYGYRSYHSGKWHIDSTPMKTGFDHSYRSDDHDRHFAPKNHSLDDKKLPAVTAEEDHYSTTAITTQAMSFLDDHAVNHGDQPFFLYLAYISPHFPLMAPAEDIAKYEGKYKVGWDIMRAVRTKRVAAMGIITSDLSRAERDLGPPYHFPDALEALGDGEVNRPAPWVTLTDEQKEFQANKMEVHAAMVDRIDQEVGRVIEQLRAMGKLEDTLIMFLSDNGASAEIMVRGDGHDPQASPGSTASYLSLGPGWSTLCNTPLRRHKTWVHEGGIATPMIAHWPRGIRRGGLVRQPGHIIDILPTIMDLAGDGDFRQDATTLPGRENAPPFPGQSLVHQLNNAPDEPRTLWWCHEGHRALRIGDWKLVASRDDPWELYDLSKDRCETNDLADRHPARVATMEKIWQDYADSFEKQLAE